MKKNLYRWRKIIWHNSTSINSCILIGDTQFHLFHTNLSILVQFLSTEDSMRELSPNILRQGLTNFSVNGQLSKSFMPLYHERSQRKCVEKKKKKKGSCCISIKLHLWTIRFKFHVIFMYHKILPFFLLFSTI